MLTQKIPDFSKYSDFFTISIGKIIEMCLIIYLLVILVKVRLFIR